MVKFVQIYINEKPSPRLLIMIKITFTIPELARIFSSLGSVAHPELNKDTRDTHSLQCCCNDLPAPLSSTVYPST